MAAVAASAIARWPHSRRTANHRSPTPGVIFVSRISAHAAGQRKPSTIAAAARMWMLPPAMSIAANGNSTPAARSRGPAMKRSARRMRSVHAATNACHGSAMRGDIACRNAGE